jgi:hypothetical protein
MWSGPDEALDLLAYQATLDSLTEPPGKLESISDPFVAASLKTS